ncbi:MAG: reductive dehalogenase [Dehalogenimonas sp.]
MKVLGLSGTAVGAASLVSPVFHDLDEVTSSENAGWKRPWWVKSVDEPTVEVDWTQVKRYDHRLMAHSAYPHAQHWGKDRWMEMVAKQSEANKKRPGTVGYKLRDTALSEGCSVYSNLRLTWNWDFTGSDKTATPESLGVPKWQGTPEESAKMIRAAAKNYGAGNIGTAELSGSEKNLVYTYTRVGILGTSTGTQWIDKWPPPPGYWRKIDFENVDVGYTDAYQGVEDVRLVLPNKPLWDIGIMIPMAKESWSTSADGISSTKLFNDSNSARYRMFHQSLLPSLQGFIRTLGYHSYGYAKKDGPGGLMPSEASAVLGGVSEMGRSSEICINPEHGSVTGYYSLLTDLELEPAKKIDAGIFRFCHTCRMCANTCPSQAISHDAEPTWEIPNFDYKVPNMCNNAGKKLFYTNMTQCQGNSSIYACNGICRAVCNFNTGSAAIAHELVKGTISTTPIFNTFFWQMSKTFGYGTLDPEDWWEMAPSLPTWGTDSTIFSSGTPYRR